MKRLKAARVVGRVIAVIYLPITFYLSGLGFVVATQGFTGSLGLTYTILFAGALSMLAGNVVLFFKEKAGAILVLAGAVIHLISQLPTFIEHPKGALFLLPAAFSYLIVPMGGLLWAAWMLYSYRRAMEKLAQEPQDGL